MRRSKTGQNSEGFFFLFSVEVIFNFSDVLKISSPEDRKYKTSSHEFLYSFLSYNLLKYIMILLCIFEHRTP